jgi:hypothetical protein
MGYEFNSTVPKNTTMKCVDWRYKNTLNRATNYMRYRHYPNCGNDDFNNGVHACLFKSGFIVVAGIMEWYLLRFILNTFNLFFALLLLARNKKGTHGRVFFVGHLKRSFAYSSLVMIIDIILFNEPYNYLTYFHFETFGVLIINLFEKV